MMVIVAYRKADRQRRTQDTPEFKQKRKENDAKIRAERFQKVHAMLAIHDSCLGLTACRPVITQTDQRQQQSHGMGISEGGGRG